MELTFNNPFYLWFLAVIPFLIISHLFTLKYARKRALKFANFEAIEAVTKGFVIGVPYTGLLKNASLPSLFARIFTLLCVILAVSGTILWYYGESSEFDYVLAIDASPSMLADDFSPNRLEAAKQAAIDFVDLTPSKSRIGIVSFAGTSFVEKRLEENREETKSKIKSLEIKKVSGTDIGGAIITASNLLSGSDKTKTAILLTDGQSNVGMSPVEAAIYANEQHITIFTIGVGTEEGGKIEGVELLSKLDETMLKAIANETGGRYYKVNDKEGLKETYKEIAAYKKRKLSKDLSLYLLLAALALLFIEWSLMNIKYRTIP